MIPDEIMDAITVEEAEQHEWIVHASYNHRVVSDIVYYASTEEEARSREIALMDVFLKEQKPLSSIRIRVHKIEKTATDLGITFEDEETTE